MRCGVGVGVSVLRCTLYAVRCTLYVSDSKPSYLHMLTLAILMTLVCDSKAAPEPAVKEGAGTDAASPVLKNDGGFMARFKALKEKKEKEAETAAANNDPVSLGEKMRAGMAGMEKPDDSDEKEKEGGRGKGNRKRGR